MSGGVRNLRAMFENKDTSTSPPQDRGRSPGGSTGVASNGTSPRPLSKIRTSFVTVEKTGQIGLQLRRENSGEPSMARRRTSFSIDEEDNPKATLERKESIASEFQARKNSSVIEETIPESAIETPSLESDKRLGIPKPKAELKKSRTSTTTAGAATSQGQANGTPKPVTVTKPAEKPINRPAPISTTKLTTAPKLSPTKSPLPKTPTTPRGRGRPAEASKKEPDKKPEKVSRPSLAPSQSSKPANQSVATSSPAHKTRILPSPPQTGFIKPKPRSPTRPVKLPASLTAHTASSGSKTATAPAPAPNSRQSLSRASGNIQSTHSSQVHDAVTRSPSRANANASTLNRKPSTLNKGSSRPSLGPPPSTLKKQSSRQSLSHSTASADDSFLARMMRPTTSSASKVLEQKPETPPKRAQSMRRSRTSDGAARTRETPKATSATPKTQAGSVVRAAAKETKPAPIIAKKEVPEEVPEPVNAVKTEIPEVPELPVEPAASGENVTPADKADVQDAKDIEEVITKAQETSVAEEPTVSPVAEEGPLVEEEANEPVPKEEEADAAAPLELTEPAKEVLTTTLEPPTPLVESTPTRKEAEELEAVTPDERISEIEGSKEDEAENEEIKVQEIEAPTASTVPVILPLTEEKKPEPTPEVLTTKPEVVEDPEDVKAREEIAKLNAEVMRAAEVD